jgi:hypothetical protein
MQDPILFITGGIIEIVADVLQLHSQFQRLRIIGNNKAGFSPCAAKVLQAFTCASREYP